MRNRPGWLGGLCRARIRKKDVVLHNPACLPQTIKQGRIVRRCRTGSVRKTPLDREVCSGMHGAWETQREAGARPEGPGMGPGCRVPGRLGTGSRASCTLFFPALWSSMYEGQFYVSTRLGPGGPEYWVRHECLPGRVFLSEISIWISRLRPAHHPPRSGWARSNQVREALT